MFFTVQIQRFSVRFTEFRAGVFILAIKKFFCEILAFIIGFFSTCWANTVSLFDRVEFSVDTSSLSAELPNIESNVNIWDFNGNTFANPKRNEENDVFEFVEYVQFMQCSGGNAGRDLFKDPYNTDVLDDYDFSNLIKNCKGVLSLGAKPLLKLGNVPMKFTKGAVTETMFGVNPYPPDDYGVYYNYIRDIAEALVDEFGREEVLSWRFGVMTEYENDDWFKTKDEDPQKTAEAYCKLYDYTVAALQDSIGENVFVGAHSMTVTEGLWDEAIFIRHCANGTNYKTGRKGTRLCSLSASFYDARPGKYTSGKTLPETIAYLKNTAESVGLNNLIYGIDEGRILSGNNSGAVGNELNQRIVGHTYQAAYDARLIHQGFESGLNYFSSWGFLSNGLLEGNPTVSYHVAKHAAQFAGSRMAACKKTRKGVHYKADISAISAFDEDENTLHIMGYNFRNKLKYKRGAELKFNINLPQLDGKKVKVTSYVIDDNCNYFDEWVEDRKTYGIDDGAFAWSPDDPSIDSTTTLADPGARDIYFNELYEKYRECSRLMPVEEEMQVVDGKLTLSRKLDPYAVVFFDVAEA